MLPVAVTEFGRRPVGVRQGPVLCARHRHAASQSAVAAGLSACRVASILCARGSRSTRDSRSAGRRRGGRLARQNVAVAENKSSRFVTNQSFWFVTHPPFF